MSFGTSSSIMRSSNGAPIPPNGLTASITAGSRGYMLIKDFNFLDHLAHFDRERIPERVVHAKGAGAFGYFEVTNSEFITKYCKAKMFNQNGKRTPVALRFSTVGGELGSADTVRDPRGFAVKFYTEEGNWDLVGNNTPIFFLRDPILFPSFIHTQKRHPSTHLKDANMMWDFCTLRPETLHQILFLFSDRGIPNGYRHMNGYGSHTFKNVNENGDAVYVKYHFKTDQGIQNLTIEEAGRLVSENPDYAIEDLYNAIQNKNYPTWTLYIQVMTFEQAESCSFNPFDVTKVWSHQEYPLHEVGRLVLNKNPTNYFSQVEQLAFSPSHFIPGIETSPDKMLQGRLFAYSDTQRYRLGVNYQQLPVNRPKMENIETYQRDGFMTYENGENLSNYYPNTINGPQESIPEHHFHIDQVQKESIKKFSTKDDDNYTQAGIFYEKILSQDEKIRLIENLGTHIAQTRSELQQRAVEEFTKVSGDLGKRLHTSIETIKQVCKPQRKMQHPIASVNPPRASFQPVSPQEINIIPRF